MKKRILLILGICYICIITVFALLNLKIQFKPESLVAHSPKDIKISLLEEYSVNGISCKNIPTNIKAVACKNSVVHKIPEYLLRNNKPKDYPSCSLISPTKLTRIRNKIWMLFIVKTAPANFKNREFMRKSLLSDKTISIKTSTIIFVVGRSKDEEINSQIKSESEKYEDLLQCDLVDTYKGLPTKVITMFGWIISANVNFMFSSVMDDDVMIDMVELVKYFEAREVQSHLDRVYCGYIFAREDRPHRTEKNKWYVSKEIYTGDKFPSFCNGPNYFLTKSMMHNLFCMATVTDFRDFYLEDVLITGVLREKMGADNENIEAGKQFASHYAGSFNQNEAMMNVEWVKHSLRGGMDSLHEVMKNEMHDGKIVKMGNVENLIEKEQKEELINLLELAKKAKNKLD